MKHFLSDEKDVKMLSQTLEEWVPNLWTSEQPQYCNWKKSCSRNGQKREQGGHYSWKLLQTPGIGIYSWKTLLENEKIKKNSWKTPEKIFNTQMKKNYILML